ncbi:4Fe-4S dicluster domain-containing protein [Tepidibacter sp. Z1-5]|uniref:4Fe-4S dicluster domain-containing protein n=1 Tax=Tepidibacter sp. Z1-5 TaxID=3134138 RepID=UPI0030BE1984
MDIINKIYNCGVVGCGGAGFPSHIKLNCTVDDFIINAAECEPLLKTDKYIIRNYSDEIIKTIDIIANQINAKNIVIALKRVYEEEIKILSASIQKMNSSVKLHFLDNFYPAGDEQVLVFEVTGKIIPESGIPLNVGTVVSNIGTVLNIADATKDIPVTDKYITVTGNVKEPRILKVPIGTSFGECIKAAEGSITDNYKIISGGPMMGTVYDKSEVENLYVTKTTSGIIVIEENSFISNQASISMTQILNRAKSSCIQCSYCTDMCPRNQIGHKIRPHKIMRYMAFRPNIKSQNQILKEALICSECGICETYACPMGLSPKRVNSYIKKELVKNNIKYERNEKILKDHPFRDYRKVPSKNIVNRMGLKKYYNKKVELYDELQIEKVSIPLKQHIGISAIPIVNLLQFVEKGQLIATCEIDEMGANIHASISGIVIEISENIGIQAKQAGDE